MKAKVVLIMMAFLYSGSLALGAAPVRIEVKVNPGKVTNRGNAQIAVWAKEDGKPVQKTVQLTLEQGQECGQISAPSLSIPGDGTPAIATFTGKEYVEDCVASIRASTDDAHTEGRITVNPAGLARPLDGVTAIAAVLIAAFAIDRTVRALLFMLSFWTRWAGAFPESSESKRSKLVYFLFAGVMGVLVIGWFGQVRILGALGFTTVNAYLDMLITGFVLVGGADRTEDILRKIGASGPAAAGSTSTGASQPIEITGRLVLDDQGRGEAAAFAFNGYPKGSSMERL